MSERVLHEWGGERTLRIVQDDFGFRCQVLDRDGDWLPTTAWEDEWLPEFNALASRVAELDAMYETSHASRMHAEDCVRRLEAENAKLRKCVKAGDAFRIKVQAAENYCAVSGIYSLAVLHGIRYEGPVWKGELEDYLAARAEVDK